MPRWLGFRLSVAYYGPTVMGSDAVGLAPIGALVVTLVIVTSTVDAPG